MENIERNMDIEFGELKTKYELLLMAAKEAMRGLKENTYYGDNKQQIMTLKGLVNILEPEPEKKKDLTATVQTAIENIVDELTLQKERN